MNALIGAWRNNWIHLCCNKWLKTQKYQIWDTRAEAAEIIKYTKYSNTGRKPGWVLDAVVDTEEEVVEEEEGEDDHDHEIVTGEETSEAASEDQEQDCECLSPAHPDNQWQI